MDGAGGGGGKRLPNFSTLKKRMGGGFRKLQSIAGPTLPPEDVDNGLFSLYSGLAGLSEPPGPLAGGAHSPLTPQSTPSAGLEAEQDLSGLSGLGEEASADLEAEAVAAAAAQDSAQRAAEDAAAKEEASIAGSGGDELEAPRPMTEAELRHQEEQRISAGVEARIRRLEAGVLGTDPDAGEAAAAALAAKHVASLRLHARGNTAADRFVRRALGATLEVDATQLGGDLEMYQPRDEATILATLPPAFLEEEFDTTREVLERLPPRGSCVNYEMYLQTELSEKDIAKDHMIGELGRRVRGKSDALEDGMKKVAAIDHELRKCHVQLSYTRHKIDSAISKVDAKARRLLLLRRRRRHADAVQGVLAELGRLVGLEAGVELQLQRGAFAEAAGGTLAAQALVTTEPFNKLMCVSGVASRLRQVLSNIEDEAEKAFLKMLVDHNFDDAVYGAVVGCCLRLRGGDRLCMLVEQQFLAAVGEAARRAVADHVDVSEKYKWMLAPLVERLPPGQLRRALFDAVGGMVDLLHSHFLVSQWHRSALAAEGVSAEATGFDDEGGAEEDHEDDGDGEGEETEGDSAAEGTEPREGGTLTGEGDDGDDERFPTDSINGAASEENTHGQTEDDAPGKSKARADSPKGSLKPGAAMDTATVAKKRRQEIAMLALVSRTLHEQRLSLWGNMATTVLSIFANVDVAAQLGLEGLAGVTMTLDTFLAVGDVFGEGIARAGGEGLRGVTRRKARDLIQRMHGDGLTMLRIYLRQEQWVAMDQAALAALGLGMGDEKEGVGRMLDQTARTLHLPQSVLLARDAVRNRILADQATNAESWHGAFFASWGAIGNPFAAPTPEPPEVDVDPLPFFLQASANSPWDLQAFLAPPMPPSQDAALSVQEMSMPPGGWVVTGAVYNAFAKVAGRYLQVMALFRGCATEVWENLEELFDLFLFSLLQYFATQYRVAGLMALDPDFVLRKSPEEAADAPPLRDNPYLSGFGEYPAPTAPLSSLPPIPSEHMLFAHLRRRIEHIVEGPAPAVPDIPPQPASAPTSPPLPKLPHGDDASPSVPPLQKPQARPPAAPKPNRSIRTTHGDRGGMSPPLLARHPSWSLSKPEEYNLSHLFGPDADFARNPLEEDPRASEEAPAGEEAKKTRLRRMGRSSSDTPMVPLFPHPDATRGLRERLCGAETATLLFALLQAAYARVAEHALLPATALARARRRLDEAERATEQLRLFIYRAAAWACLGGKALVARVAGVGWDFGGIREGANDYVEAVVARGAAVHSFLDEKEPPMRKEQFWAEFCQACMETLVEGFSRVKNCSTEGRALMSMDVQALHQGLSALEPARATRSRVWADAYVKAFYFGEADVVRWIDENYASYHLRHMEALLLNGVGKTLRRKRRQELLNHIRSLYPYGFQEVATPVPEE